MNDKRPCLSFGNRLEPPYIIGARTHRPVSCYALFKWWLLLSQHPGCQCTLTSFYTEPIFWGLSWRSGLFPFRQRSLSPAVSLQSSDVTAFGVWLSSVTREGPSPIQCSTSVTKRITLHLNAFRGEPAISAFDWHFTRLPTAHPSILQHTPVRASTGSYTRFPLAMGRSRSFGSTDDNIGALFGLAFAQPPW